MQSRQPWRLWCVAVDIKIQLLPAFLLMPQLPKTAGVSDTFHTFGEAHPDNTFCVLCWLQKSGNTG